MNNDKVYHWLLASSADPTKLSLTIKGLATFVPTFLILTQLLGWHSLNQAGLVEFIDQLAMFAGALVTVIGLGRKVYIAFQKI